MHACEKLLRHYRLVVEGCGQESQNGRRLSRAEMDHVVPVQGRRYTVRYSSSVVCTLWTESVGTQHCVRLGIELEIAQTAVRGWNRNTPEEWFLEATRKLPRRWQPYTV